MLAISPTTSCSRNQRAPIATAWQWTAGCGTDAAPFFHVFNPSTQGVKLDPHGTYVRRWVPERKGVADAGIS